VNYTVSVVVVANMFHRCLRLTLSQIAHLPPSHAHVHYTKSDVAKELNNPSLDVALLWPFTCN